jgi:6-phosphofructokinase
MRAMNIGLVKGSGDCPGLNAVIRAAAKAGALKRLQAETAPS